MQTSQNSNFIKKYSILKVVSNTSHVVLAIGVNLSVSMKWWENELRSIMSQEESFHRSERSGDSTQDYSLNDAEVVTPILLNWKNLS